MRTERWTDGRGEGHGVSCRIYDGHMSGIVRLTGSLCWSDRAFLRLVRQCVRNGAGNHFYFACRWLAWADGRSVQGLEHFVERAAQRTYAACHHLVPVILSTGQSAGLHAILRQIG